MEQSKSPNEIIGTTTSKRNWLLRLIQSEMFSVWIALSYLQKYPPSEVGIHYYICQRLRDCPQDLVEFMIPQLCHLVTCLSTGSTPLEYFLLELCQKSIHASIITLWTLENYLFDFKTNYIKQSELYTRCAIFLNEVQTVVFGDFVINHQVSRKQSLMSLLSPEEAALATGLDTLPNLRASIVAFGCIAGTFGYPGLPKTIRPLVLIEARKGTLDRPPKSKPIRSLSALSGSKSASPLASPLPTNYFVPTPALPAAIPSLEDLHHGKAFSLKEYLIKAARQMNVTPPSFMSVMTSGASNNANAGNNANMADPLKYRCKSEGNQTSFTFKPCSAVPLYYHAEMQFIMSLIDISRRLCLVEKSGRQHALHAELNLLNHNLPASVCLPLWCQGHSDSQSRQKGHHRILRIVPEDAVVLNSAERVPFVAYIEIIENIDDDEFLKIKEDSKLTVRSSSSNPPYFEAPAKISTNSSYSIHEDIPNEQKLDKTTTEAANSNSNSAIIGPNDIVPLMDTQDFAERMRTAAIMLTQLTRQSTQPNVPAAKLADINAIKGRIIGEMEALEKTRLLDALQAKQAGQGPLEPDAVPVLPGDSIIPVEAKDDPSAPVFRERWDEKKRRIRNSSGFGKLENWDLRSVIVKSGADMRQEQLATQLIEEMHNIWAEVNLPLWTYPYRVLVASSNGGLVETVRNALSIHSIKKNAYKGHMNQPGYVYTLRDHFIKSFGSPDSAPFLKARENFLNSLAAYSLVTYVLLLRDRHNGNILLDAEGHIIHIDFGFMLSNSPGGYVGFESAPFKLSPEYIELLGGLGSPTFDRFKDLLFLGFQAIRKHADRIMLLVEIMQIESRLPCFYTREAAVSQLRQRLQLSLTEAQIRQFVDRMVTSSAYNVFTKLYDSFQYYSNGIL